MPSTPPASPESPGSPESAPSEPSEPSAEWNTSPVFEPQGGPDNASDAALAAMNGVVALWRKVTGWFRRG